MRKRNNPPAGFTLVEVLIGLLILGLVMTTSLAVFYDREQRIRHAEEVFLVWQAMANEAELLRYRPWASLSAEGSEEFRSDLSILDPLEDVVTTVKTEQIDPQIKSVTLRIEWGNGRSASTQLIRSHTGGSNLW